MPLTVLYVDTLSDAQAQTNVRGILKAYQKKANVIPFDYRRIARFLGPGIMNCLLYLTARIKRPDFIHLGKCESVRGKTIQKIKKAMDCKVIHFYGDFRETPRPQVVDIGQYADITLLYHKDERLLRAHAELGVKPLGFWWVGTDPEVYYPRQIEQQYDVVFFANNSDFLPGHEQRRQLIKAIADAGIEIHLFGQRWDLFKDYPNVHLHDFVVEADFSDVCSKAKITLGENAVHDVYYYASWRRPFNCMASGAFHLTRYFSGLDEVFQDKEHLVWFNSNEQAVQMIQYYLGHPIQRDRIAEQGRQEVIQKHTWDHRIREMIDIYQNLKA